MGKSHKSIQQVRRGARATMGKKKKNLCSQILTSVNVYDRGFQAKQELLKGVLLNAEFCWVKRCYTGPRSSYKASGERGKKLEYGGLI